MIYGNSYEGTTRECEACGHFTNVHSDCGECGKGICENCSLHGQADDFCSDACKQKACAHVHVHYECFDDSDLSVGYRDCRESWTCRDCGADLSDESEEYVSTERKAA